MSRCDLDRWSLDLELLKRHFGCHTSKLCTKFERNQIIYGWVIDDLARFRVQLLGVGHNWQSFLTGTWAKLHQTWKGHRALITALHFCFNIRISCCIFKCGRLKVERCWKWRQISHFLTPLWKLSKRWARFLCQLLKLYLPPNLRNWWPSTAWLLSTADW